MFVALKSMWQKKKKKKSMWQLTLDCGLGKESEEVIIKSRHE